MWINVTHAKDARKFTLHMVRYLLKEAENVPPERLNIELIGPYSVHGDARKLICLHCLGKIYPFISGFLNRKG